MPTNYDQYGGNLEDNAIGLLGSVTFDAKTAAATTILTVPGNKTARITHVVVRNPTASLAGGTSYTVTGFAPAAFSLATLTSTTGYVVVTPTALALQAPTAGGTDITITVTTGATLAANATIDVFGYYA